MKHYIFITAVLLLLTGYSYAQTGNLRGKVLDKLTEQPLDGAAILVNGSSDKYGVTDEKGNFTIDDIPIGRYTLKVSYIGYEETNVTDVVITTGKDAAVSILLNEKFDKLNEVVVVAEITKNKPINKMATVSARQFTMEEVGRYAGGRSDIAKLASNFAGVAASNDATNVIVVRGNASTGMLWRIEGIPVPSPNHFSQYGTTGSAVSALNPNLVANSDFFLGAFPAEYGNALSGVFDIRFRKGNTKNVEYTASLGAFPGAEFMAEGPLGKREGSFVASARYGVAGLIGAGGTGSAQPNYYDLSFNLDFGNSQLGNFSLFGIGGSSNIEFLGKDADEKDLFSAKDADSESISRFGVLGVKHSIGLSDNTNLKTIVSSSITSDKYIEDRYYNLNTPEEAKLKYTDADNKESRIALNTTLNSKFSSSLFLRTGLLWEHFMNDTSLLDSDKQPDDNGDGYSDINLIYSSNDNYDVLQNYAQVKYRFNDRVSINTGLHTQYFSLNKQFVLEPRLSGTWTLNTKNSLNLGYGIHHQNIAAPVLFLIDDLTDTQPNQNLDLVRSQHFALSYDLKLAEKWRAKTEVYYQLIDNAAVETTPSSYSSLTEGTDFGFSTDKTSLVNEGTRFNRGVEFTLEKFFSDGYHALMTTTLFESKFEGSDGVERNSPFNNKYIFNALGGKEFKIGAAKKNIFSIDGKLTTMGGRFYTPVDLAASQAAGYEIKDDANAYTKQYDPYFRLDVKFAMKLNHASKKRSHQFYIDFQNVTNKENIFANTYNRLTNEVNRVNQLGFFPDFGYKFQF